MRQTLRQGAKAKAADTGAVARPYGEAVSLPWQRECLRIAYWLRDACAREAQALEPTAILAIGLGIGVAVYFSAPEEPGFLGPSVALILALVLAYRLRERWWLYLVCVGLTAIAMGFLAGKVRTLGVTAPQLIKPATIDVNAVILSIEPRNNGSARLIARPVSFGAFAAGQAPAKIRVTTQRIGSAQAGDAVRFKAILRPPPQPAVPGGFDFARNAFFDGIGAVGFVAGKLQSLQQRVEMGAAERWTAWLDRARNALTLRIAAAIPGESGTIAAALVTGKRGLIPDDTNQALRASGLYHVVSISGLHMAVFASGLFWFIRALLSLSMRLTLTMPLKSVSAALSLVPAAAYTIFSGGEVATIRAFIMTAIVLCAIAIGRSAITRRNVGIAASIVLLTTPEELLGPSFQMSFAAVAMLVAWYDRPRPMGSGSVAARPIGLWRLIIGLLLTTLIASLATAPFAAFHFHRLTLQALASNVLATPLVSILIMPLALLALLAEPFGYGLPIWQAMGVTVDWFMIIARVVASWPGADVIVSRIPQPALIAFAVSLLMIAVFRTRLALAALCPVAIGVTLSMMTHRPVAIIGANGHAALVRDGDTIRVIAKKTDNFVVQEWLLAMGDRRRSDDPSLTSGVLCDLEGCSAPLGKGAVLMLDKTANAIEEDCNQVAILVASLVIPASCGESSLIFDRSALERAGVIEIYQDDDRADAQRRWRLVSARQPENKRPWIPAQQKRTPKESQPIASATDLSDEDL